MFFLFLWELWGGRTRGERERERVFFLTVQAKSAPQSPPDRDHPCKPLLLFFFTHKNLNLKNYQFIAPCSPRVFGERGGGAKKTKMSSNSFWFYFFFLLTKKNYSPSHTIHTLLTHSGN